MPAQRESPSPTSVSATLGLFAAGVRVSTRAAADDAVGDALRRILVADQRLGLLEEHRRADQLQHEGGEEHEADAPDQPGRPQPCPHASPPSLPISAARATATDNAS